MILPMSQTAQGLSQQPIHQVSVVDKSRSTFHRYVHMYYDDVESEYREDVFKLGI